MTHEASNCTIKVNHTKMWCRLAAGVGAGYEWSIVIGQQASRISFAGNTTSYAPPTVTGDGSATLNMPAAGGASDVVWLSFSCDWLHSDVTGCL